MASLAARLYALTLARLEARRQSPKPPTEAEEARLAHDLEFMRSRMTEEERAELPPAASPPELEREG